MRCALALCILLAAVASPAAQPAPPLVLNSDTTPVWLDPSLEFLLDSTGQLTVDQIALTPAERFTPVVRSKLHHIESGALWLRFDAVIVNPAYDWRLTLPLPGVDEVSLYFRNRAGQWVHQQAGDTVRMDVWPLPGPYPVFSLSHEIGQTVTYYMQIHHARVPFSALPRVVSDTQLLTSRQSEHMLLGIYFGLAALVIVLALANALAYRDWGFGQLCGVHDNVRRDAGCFFRRGRSLLVAVLAGTEQRWRLFAAGGGGRNSHVVCAHGHRAAALFTRAGLVRAGADGPAAGRRSAGRGLPDPGKFCHDQHADQRGHDCVADGGRGLAGRKATATPAGLLQVFCPYCWPRCSRCCATWGLFPRAF